MRVLLASVLLLCGCYSSAEHHADAGPAIDLDGDTRDRDAEAVPTDSGTVTPADSGTITPADAGTVTPAGCTPHTDATLQALCNSLIGPGTDSPGPTAPRITSFTWSYDEPCSDGDPTWFSVDLTLEDPDDATEDLVVCGMLMGGGTGWFDARHPSCQIAQVGGDSLNLVVGDPAGNSSRVGAVVHGCSSGTGP